MVKFGKNGSVGGASATVSAAMDGGSMGVVNGDAADILFRL